MYAHEHDHVDAYLEGFDDVLAELVDAINNGQIEARLRGLPASTGFKRLT